MIIFSLVCMFVSGFAFGIFLTMVSVCVGFYLKGLGLGEVYSFVRGKEKPLGEVIASPKPEFWEEVFPHKDGGEVVSGGMVAFAEGEEDDSV